MELFKNLEILLSYSRVKLESKIYIYRNNINNVKKT